MTPAEELARLRETHTTLVGFRAMFPNPRSLERNRQQCAELRQRVHSLVPFLRHERENIVWAFTRRG